ncbi:MAG: glycoside hydrolase family 88 protein [Ferruginibacter sp.]|nr:glycoside hydrolase family 88 protein [Ferruginibacter sp.]
MLVLIMAVHVTFAMNNISGKEPPLKPKSILKTMEKVADWQLAEWEKNGFRWPKWDWTNAAGYTGFFELGNISKNKAYHNFLLTVGNELGWNTGPNRFYADDYCIGQTYANLYVKYKDEKMIANFRLLADSIIARPHTESLEWKNEINHREWAWCDALFMGPPSLSYLATATGDSKYLDISDRLWWKTYDYLYDKEEHLFYRDGSNFGKKEKNGKKVFWSRGNGWVMGGLVRVIDNLPADYPARPKYIALYKEMAVKIASLQQPDGTWHTSLLDPESYPTKETSGTGFYTYALLWGLNNGLLNKSAYWPVVQKSWKAMVASIRPDGMLGYVQQIGWKPEPVSENSTAIYGVGAFLLAGSQMYQYLKIPN